MVPFLHAADALSHAPPWMLALLLAGGAAFGLLLTSGPGLWRRVAAAAPEVRLLESGRRDSSWWARVAVPREGLPPEGWQLVTREGRAIAPQVEALAGGELALEAALGAGDEPVELRFEPARGKPWRETLR